MSLRETYAAWLVEHPPTDSVRASVLTLALERLAGLPAAAWPEELRLPRLREGVRAPEGVVVSEADLLAELHAAAPNDELERRVLVAHALGQLLDTLHAIEALGRRSGQKAERRFVGSYFTPRLVARAMVEESMAQEGLARRLADEGARLCDPAMGGGAFLIEAVRGLVLQKIREGEALESALEQAARITYGIDRSPLAVATAEAALWLLSGTANWQGRLLPLDALEDSEAMRALGPFDWILGNPPWVAYQGRAAQPLGAEQRASLRRRYSAFAGYPTLHGVFTERATELAPRGYISFLLPSSVSDLEGYGATRAAVLRAHVPLEPLEEFGQDAFEGVVQPCFGLLARPRSEASDAGKPRAAEPFPSRPWQLRERARAGGEARTLEVPAALTRLGELPLLPPECFGELGLQSNPTVVAQLFHRSDAPEPPFLVPLLEGRNVGPFVVRAARLFLHLDRAVLEASGCRYRPDVDYQKVDFVVRQTAPVTIAAKLKGVRFRNSLLAGYARADLDADLLVGLLNSTLFRALHSSRRRDARQAIFPQVKVAHLRSLPLPPGTPLLRQAVRDSSRKQSERGPTSEGQLELDRAVFELFGIDAREATEVTAYLAARWKG